MVDTIVVTIFVYPDGGYRIGSTAAVGQVRLLRSYCIFLAKRAGFRAAQPLSTEAGIGRPSEPG